MGFLKIISNGYFYEDHLEGIINPKFQLSIISGWRDIAGLKCRPRFYRPEFESAIFFYLPNMKKYYGAYQIILKKSI